MEGTTTHHTASEILEKDLESIYIGNLNTVDEDLIFPEVGKYGSTFTWHTGEERFIEAAGKVHRPLHGMGNRKVELTVVAEYSGEKKTRQFTATVLQEAKVTVVEEIRRTMVNAEKGKAVTLPSVAIVSTSDGRTMTMEVKWEDFTLPAEEGSQILVKGHISDCEIPAEAVITVCGQMPEEETPEQKLAYVPLTEVRLLDGSYHAQYQKGMLEYLEHTSDDQMLYNFRKASGLDTLGAPPMTGWDEDSCKLKGHTTGHYLSGLALAWGATGREVFREKLTYMTRELKKCQEAFAEKEEYHRGFLSAYSEEQFDLLEKFTKYPEIWAPWYTLDKIMSGLYDCYRIAGDETALEVLDLMGDWTYDRLSRLSKETLDKMWSMYIAGEFGGMLGTMVKLYEITGKETHLQAAKLFFNEKLFVPMEEGCDTLEDMHANQHIPQILGAMDLFRAVKEKPYWEIGKNFWEIVTGGHIYCIGGTGETEMFHRAGTTCSLLTDKSAESCASYNMLRLTGQIFAYTGEGSMMDYYDNTLRNHILTSCSHEADGGTTYFLPLGAGMQKEYSTTENTCCHGTGMESRFRYMENIYAENESAVYVNLLIPSEWNGRIRQEETIQNDIWTVRFTCLGQMDRGLKIHIPGWAGDKFHVCVDGKACTDAAREQGYLVLPGAHHEGEEIVVEMPMEIRVVTDDAEKGMAHLEYGPYILAAISDETDFMPVPDPADIHRTGELHFETGTLKLMPFAEVDLEQYHVYFRANA